MGVRDIDTGKRMVEEMVLEQLLDSFPLITGWTLTDDWAKDFPRVEGSPDFVVGIEGIGWGIELAEVRGADNAWSYYDEASRIAWKKHESYARRGLFANPIALVFHSDHPPLFDVRHALTRLAAEREFDPLGFVEVWAVDFSDAYFSPGHAFRLADVFCFKPSATSGFHRIGDHGRKPYG
jgi:hypothetical protein